MELVTVKQRLRVFETSDTPDLRVAPSYVQGRDQAQITLDELDGGMTLLNLGVLRRKAVENVWWLSLLLLLCWR